MCEFFRVKQTLWYNLLTIVAYGKNYRRILKQVYRPYSTSNKRRRQSA